MSGKFPKAIEEIQRHLQTLPGIGRRTAERLAMAMMEWDESRLKALGEYIRDLKDRVHICVDCGNYSDTERCRICTDTHRDRRLICVIEHPRLIPIFESSGSYRGLYHVLGGRIAPLEGVEFEDLNTAALFKRLKEGGVEEVVLATSPDVEGEATAAYMVEALSECAPDLKITRIALGVPVGSDLSYADGATLGLALNSRREIN